MHERLRCSRVPAEQQRAEPWLEQCLTAWRGAPASTRRAAMLVLASKDGAATRIAAALLRAAEKE